MTHPAGSAGLALGVRGTEQETAIGDLASTSTAAAATAAECPKRKLIISINFYFNFSKHFLYRSTITRGE